MIDAHHGLRLSEAMYHATIAEANPANPPTIPLGIAVAIMTSGTS
jgi:hypothetical protein